MEAQLEVLKKKIAELEGKDAYKPERPKGSAGTARSKTSGFRTPPQGTDSPLIDLSSPPKDKGKDKDEGLSLLDLPAFPDTRARSESPKRRTSQSALEAGTSGTEAHRQIGEYQEERAGNVVGKETGFESTDKKHQAPEDDARRMDLHPLMATGRVTDVNDRPPGLGGVIYPGLPGAATTAVKTKEADDIKIPPLPEVPRFLSWKQQVRDNVMSASGRGREVYPWLLEVENMSISFDALANSYGLDSLDVKLSAAINKVKKGRVEKILTNMDETAAAQGGYISGRQKLRVIYEQYELDKAKGQLYDIRNLSSLKFPGDENLEAFLDVWDEIIQRLTKHPGDDVLREILCPLMEESTVLKGAMDIYHLADPGTPQRSYEFLHRALSLHVDKRRQQRNREDTVEAMNKYLKGRTKVTMPVAEAANEENHERKVPAAPAKEKKGGTGPCYAFLRGNCNRGASCKYAHDGKEGSMPQLTEEQKKELAAKRSQIPCRLHSRGLCKFGDKCQYKHDTRANATAAACIEDEDTASQGSGEEGEVVFSCPAAEGGTVREWIVDTGTENHLVAASRCNPDVEDVYESDRPLRLATANGTIVANQRVDKRIDELGLTVDPLVLERTVDALSVGRLVLEKEYSFHWPSGSEAYLVSPCGRKTTCETRGFVPVLRADRIFDSSDCEPAAPGVGEGEEGQERFDRGTQTTGEGRDDESKDERLKREAMTTEHMLTHRPKNPWCWVCGLTKMNQKPARRCPLGERSVKPEAFGQHVCVDHVFIGKDPNTIGTEGQAVGVFMFDLFTQLTDFAPTKTKSANEALIAVKQFMGETTVGTLYSDCSPELAAVAKELITSHQTSTPYRPQSNSLVERAIRTFYEGTRAALVQAGLPHRFWPMAARHQTVANAISCKADGGPSPWNVRHGADFDGWRLPFGCLVHYRPPKPILKSLKKFDPRTVPGIFVGWHLEPGYSFRGDYLVLPLTMFQVTGRKKYKAHRIKELVHFDEVQFPLQKAMAEARTTVKEPKEEGDLIWPDEVVADDGREEEDQKDESKKKANIDIHFENLFGIPPPEKLSYEEKYRECVKELFGDEEPLAVCDIHDEESTYSKDKDDAAAQIFGSDGEDEASPGEDLAGNGDLRAPSGPLFASDDEEIAETRDDVPDDDRNRGEVQATTSVPRARRIHLPRIRDSTASPAAPAFDANSWTNDPSARRDKSFIEEMANTRVCKTSAVARKLNDISNRKLLEFCCSEDSRLGNRRYVELGCQVVRLTVKHDLTTKEGVDVALKAVHDTPEGKYLHLWGSLPCTGGSPWQRINRARGPATAEKIDLHREQCLKLLEGFCQVAEEVVARGGDISFEWPTSCSFWDEPDVVNMIQRYSMNKVHMHGCAAGLKSEKTDRPIKKPWTIASTSPVMLDELSKFRCPGPPEHEEHEPCAGQETKKTELYTSIMTDSIHTAVREEALAYRARHAISLVGIVDGEHDEALKELGELANPPGHREKMGPEGLWCAMITKTLEPGDPLNRHPDALKAIGDELSELRKIRTWDEAHPIEASEVCAKYPGAHLARIFPIIGIKHFEDVEMRRWKGRIVVAGNKIKTVTGQWATFQEVGSIPSTMASCRCLLTLYATSRGYHLLQSDCIRAYVQAPMKGPKTFIRLPKAWWPAEWVGKFRDPVCELLLALYGHPHAGDFWYDRLESELRKLNFETVEGWPSVFILYPDDVHTIAFAIYVDDLIMTGPDHILEVVSKIRENIVMEDPGQMQKYLGCIHHVVQKMKGGETITQVAFDMQKYFESALAEYRELNPEKLHRVDSPYAPRLNDKELDSLLAQPGKMAANAASLVMRLMYGVRMAAPHLSIAVTRLSAQITKWSRESDRRLHRIFSYIAGASHMQLMGQLSTEDRDNLTLVAWPDADLAGDLTTTKSTSGFFMEVIGSGTPECAERCFPITWGCHRQGSTSQHTGEAEIVSLASCLRKELMPTQILLSKLLRRPVKSVLCEDNNTAIISVRKGYSPNMRHLARTQRISIGLLHETINDEADHPEGDIELIKIDTKVHKGDMFTKELEVRDYVAAIGRIGVRAPESSASSTP